MTAAVFNKTFSDYEFQPVIEAPVDTNKYQINDIVERLNQSKQEFANLSIESRISLIDSIHQGFKKVTKRSVQASCAAKGIEFGTPAEGEEWISGPLCIFRHLRLLKESLEQIKKTGTTKIEQPATLSNGQLSIPIFPNRLIDKTLFKEASIEMRMDKNYDLNALEKNRASFYRNNKHDGKIVLILGAGNLSSIPAMDVLTKMFNEGKSCILKMNPVNAYLGYFIEEAFKEAIEKNYLAVVYGKVEQAKRLLNHDEIDELHITGSNKTHDYIYWGAPGTERANRMARNLPVNTKPSTSALGNISPVIIFPGKYTKEELAFQAEDIASSLNFNSGYMCSVPVSLFTYKYWPQRAEFLTLLETEISKLEPRRAYYPGAKERWHNMVMSSMKFKVLGEEQKHSTPWAFAKGISEDQYDFELYQNEPFCAVISETTLNAEDELAFLNKAVYFVNNKVWGTLSASIIIDPRSAKNKQISSALEKTITDLEYGTVAINSSFTALSFITAAAAWGAYPGSVLSNIQSGRGWIHNTSMVEGIEKMVAKFPIVSSRKPFYFTSHKKKLSLAHKLLDYEMNPKWSNVSSILLDMVFV